jgi:peptidyl-dipeptidase Dcp
MQAIAEKFIPMMTAHGDEIYMNDGLFARIKNVKDNASKLGLDKVQERLVDKYYKRFVRKGALLNAEQKEELKKINQRESELELAFGKNVMREMSENVIYVTNKSQLAGLSQEVIDGAAELAKKRGHDGWAFTATSSTRLAVLNDADNRDLREKMYKLYTTTASHGDQWDNSKNINEILKLRQRKAKLLGFETYADYALEPRMAKNTPTVLRFLDRLMEPSLPKAREEVAELLRYARTKGFEEDALQPWDLPYWAERYRKAYCDLDDALLKPYFPLEDCIDAVFGLAGTLYGLSFRPADIPVYHPDVRAYEVLDADGAHLAFFYADFFPRASKRSGAWMTEFRGQYRIGEKDVRPLISIVTNFSKPTGESPSLLTHDELTTLLHEFGHSLHGMLSQGRYPSMSGTNVARDFVELPSQIMENWAFEPAFLRTFAKHYKTREPIPESLVERIVRSRNYLSAYYQVRQLQFGLIDMAWHTLETLPEEGTVDFERRVLTPYRTLPAVPGTAQSPTFGHIFNGGYSAGYYSYKWAEVLEADAFEAFRENGIFDRGTAGSFRKNILERGSSEDEGVLFRRFRGHDPEPDALLRKLGIIS